MICQPNRAKLCFWYLTSLLFLKLQCIKNRKTMISWHQILLDWCCKEGVIGLLHINIPMIFSDLNMWPHVCNECSYDWMYYEMFGILLWKQSFSFVYCFHRITFIVFLELHNFIFILFFCAEPDLLLVKLLCCIWCPFILHASNKLLCLNTISLWD